MKKIKKRIQEVNHFILLNGRNEKYSLSVNGVVMMDGYDGNLNAKIKATECSHTNHSSIK